MMLNARSFQVSQRAERYEATIEELTARIKNVSITICLFMGFFASTLLACFANISVVVTALVTSIKLSYTSSQVSRLLGLVTNFGGYTMSILIQPT